MADAAHVRQRVLEILRRYVDEAVTLENVDDTARLLEDLQINSARLVDITLDVEDAFDVSIADDTADRLLTVGDIVTFVTGQRR